ncbi:MAG: T9SS type A sorting domain-containing protein, partial [Bacteroidota bacterium]
LNVTFYNNSTSTYSIVSQYWVFGDGSQDTIENPVHYYFIADSFYVSLDILSSTGCWDTFIDTVYIGTTCDSTTQLNKKPKEYKIKLFPTVIDYYFKIENNNYCKPMEFNMFDIWGRKVMELEISEQETEVTRNNLPSGLYFYSIFFEENVIKTGKLLFK